MTLSAWRNTKERYGYIAQFLHWAFVFGFIFMFVIAEVMMNMTTTPTNTFFGQGKWALYGLHKSVGVLLLFLITLRVLWKLSNPIPTVLGHGIQKLLATLVHVGLYGVMIALPISGYLMSSMGGYGVKLFGLPLPDLLGENKAIADIAHNVHGIAAEATYYLIILHIVGALFHHYIIKDDTFLRLFWRNKK